MSNITKKDIEKLAQLAHLGLEENEYDEIENDMNKMLDFIGQLKEVDTEDTNPLIYVLDQEPSLRKDIVSGEVSQKEALKNAPEADSDYFKVAKIITK